MATDPTNAILNAGARDVLRPMGLVRKGRSRTWFDDHGWWLIVVEFQPSGIFKGSYLNVGVSWLWTAEPHSYVWYDFSDRVQGVGGSFESEEQWRGVVDRLVSRSAEEVQRYRQVVPNVEAAALECVRRERAIAENVRATQGREARASWATWNAAVASGLAGDVAAAVRFFTAVAQSPAEREFWVPVRKRSAAWSELVQRDHDAFVEAVRRQTEKQRQALNLPTQFPE